MPTEVSDPLSVSSQPNRAEQMQALAPSFSQVFLALGGLLYVDTSLRFRSFAVLRQQLLAIRQPADASAIDPACIATAIAAIDRAAMFYPRRAMCLQRSAVLTWLLRRQGIAADLVLGCRHTPFYAHAWVEVDRTVVNDTLRVKQLYPEIERI